MSTYTYIGQAVEYPLVVANGSMRIAVGKEVVENAFIMILTTPVGTRYFLPEYGSRIGELLWEPNDDVLSRLLRTFIMNDLNTWEKRSRVVDVKVIVGVDIALCLIRYKILGKDDFGVFPYPYYRNKQ